jgi:hypothetical protein
LSSNGTADNGCVQRSRQGHWVLHGDGHGFRGY